MIKERVREKETESKPAPPPLVQKRGKKEVVEMVPKIVKARPRTKKIEDHLEKHQKDPRFQRELKEMKETHDLDEIDDDVEDDATILEWFAEEHNHRPKAPKWFAVLAGTATLVVGVQLFFFANVMGAITISLIAGMTYYIAQHKPPTARYRIMVDGVAINNTLYHFRDLESFNVVYEPNETMTVILRSKKRFSPFIHLELGDMDPVEVRETLFELMDEDQELEEPMADILARRLGF